MDLGALRTLALDLNFSAHGVSATVTPPAPDDTAVTTTAIWVLTPEEPQPVGSGFRRREPRRVLALKRSAVADVVRGTTIVAPERLGGANKTWVVDEIDRTEADHWRLLVKAALS